MAASILNGIARDSVIRIAQDLGFEVVEQNLPRESLYLADEVFFTGTAAEVTPIRSVLVQLAGVTLGRLWLVAGAASLPWSPNLPPWLC